jgi:hypothetical protein
MSVRHALKRATRARAEVRVIVELQRRSADEEALDHLRGLGLVVQRVVGNKVIGAIPESRLRGLEKDESVRAVERSEKLRIHPQ